MLYLYKLISAILTQNYYSNIIYKTQNDLAKHCKTRVDLFILEGILLYWDSALEMKVLL